MERGKKERMRESLGGGHTSASNTEHKFLELELLEQGDLHFNFFPQILPNSSVRSLKLFTL